MIVFCHGMDTGSLGPKYRSLVAAFGEDKVLAPDCEGVYDLKERIRIVGAATEGLTDLVFVGSSFGGRVSVVYALRHPGRVRGLVLCNPALGSPLKGAVKLPPTVILHAVDDAIIPIFVSERFAEEHKVRLVRVEGDDHKFDKSHHLLVEEVGCLLDGLRWPWTPRR